MKGGRGGTPARKINFVSYVAYGPKDFLLSLSHGGFTASETRKGVSQQINSYCCMLNDCLNCVFKNIVYIDNLLLNLCCVVLD